MALLQGAPLGTPTGYQTPARPSYMKVHGFGPLMQPVSMSFSLNPAADQVVHFAVEMAAATDALPARGQEVLPARYA